MTLEELAREYPEVISVFQDLQVLFGEEKAQELISKLLSKPYGEI